MSSSDKINYLLRPNKSVERRLFVELLQRLAVRFPVSEYRYIGLGSMWFVDFILFHRVLGLTDLISIEEHSPDRAEFNRPFACIEVVKGRTTRTLPLLNLDAKRCVMWLDYDTGPEGPAREDIQIVCERVPSGSIVLVTLNAHRDRLKFRDPSEDRELSRGEALQHYFANLTARPIADRELSIQGYPRLLAQLLLRHIRHCLRAAGRDEKALPLVNFSYNDGAPMISVGVMIANATDRDELARCAIDELDFRGVEGEDDQYEIKVPHLTAKEKLYLDRLLPFEGVFSASVFRDEHKFSLSQEQLNAYRRFYRYYPVFGEYFL